jgi:two-component system LytT family response regulator
MMRQTSFVCRLLVGERSRAMYVLRMEDIDYVQSHGNYVKLHVGPEEYLSRDSIKRLAEVMAAQGFVRVERSLLVNLRVVHQARRTRRGSYTLILASGSQLRSGAGYRDRLLRGLSELQVPT